MQTVSPETAKRLEKLGLKWTETKQGDCYLNGGIVYWHRVSPDEPCSGIDDLWLPRLDQVLEEIRRRVSVREIIFTWDNACVVLTDEPIPVTLAGESGLVSYEREAAEDTEAAGLVLVEIMEMPGA